MVQWYGEKQKIAGKKNSSRLFLSITGMFMPGDLLDPLAPEVRQRGSHLAHFIQSAHVVSSTNALAIDQDIRHCTTTSGVRQDGLELLPQSVVVEFDHVRCRDNGVVIKQDMLGFGAERAVGLGEDDNWKDTRND